MFDKEHSGFVAAGDLQTILRSLGRDPSEASELLSELGIYSEGNLSFDQFLRLMKNLENRLVATNK